MGEVNFNCAKKQINLNDKCCRHCIGIEADEIQKSFNQDYMIGSELRKHSRANVEYSDNIGIFFWVAIIGGLLLYGSYSWHIEGFFWISVVVCGFILARCLLIDIPLVIDMIRRGDIIRVIPGTLYKNLSQIDKIGFIVKVKKRSFSSLDTYRDCENQSLSESFKLVENYMPYIIDSKKNSRGRYYGRRRY